MKLLSEKTQAGLAHTFAICWAGAVLADPQRRADILRPFAWGGLVSTGKNGRPKLELTKLGEETMAFARAKERSKP